MQIVSMSKTIAIIPARGGSKRIPEKNIQIFGGLPLMVHSILYAQKNSDIIDDIYVSTDNDEIKIIALQYGAKVIDRPASLSGDLEPTITALIHALEYIDNDEIENIILLQPTNPLRPENLLKETFSLYQNENLDSLFTVSRNYQKLHVDHRFDHQLYIQNELHQMILSMFLRHQNQNLLNFHPL